MAGASLKEEVVGKNTKSGLDTQEEREATAKPRESFCYPLLNASYEELITKTVDHNRLDAKGCTWLYVLY